MVDPNGNACFGYVTADSFQFDGKVYEAVECDEPPTGDLLEEIQKSKLEKLKDYFDSQDSTTKASLITNGIDNVLTALKLSDAEAASILATNISDSEVTKILGAK